MLNTDKPKTIIIKKNQKKKLTILIPNIKLINKLVILVNESCNLNCSYCYFRLSPNQRTRKKMEPIFARKIVSSFLSNYDGCNLIQFFGGEPTLNLGAIEATIEETNRLVDCGKLKNKPRFAIVTNGVFRDFEQTIDLLKRYNIETTVSFDGPAVIHNELRPEKTKVSTHDRVEETIGVLLKAKLPVAMETVYTSLHIEKKCSIVDIFNICQEMGISKLILQTAYPPAPNRLNPLLDPFFDQLLFYYKEAVDWWFRSLIYENKMMLDVYFKDILQPIIEGVPAKVAINGCPAGEKDFAVSPKGEIFACQLLYGYPDYKIGSVCPEQLPPKTPLFPKRTNEIKTCGGCFARHWCQPCAALNLYWGNPWMPPVRECKLRRSVVSRIGYWAFRYLAIPKNETTEVLRKELLINNFG
ncbi:MAG: radical SAM protein [Candidatus Bathyarchaeia archaeon]